MIECDIKKSFGDFCLDLKVEFKSGSIVAITGGSGNGKSTFLRVLAGLEDAEGFIKVDDKVWLDQKGSLPPQKRGIGFLFQSYALFNNMSVEENLLYIKNDKSASKKLLDMVELTNLKDRLPQTLSGGQKQRVALARAFMNKPKIVLMDEPLSALDERMRTKLQNDIKELHKEFGSTILFVSHDPSEIYKLADEMIVLKDGKLEKKGTPKEILLKTSGSQKLSFLGELLEIRKTDVVYVAVVSIGKQIVEVVLSEDENKGLKPGQKVSISTKAFGAVLTKGV